MNIYSYCRISTAKQSIDRQIRNIKAEYPTAHIVQEAYTGTSIFRPEWLKLYRVLKAGDTAVFDSVSRMSRNAEEGFALYEDLYHIFFFEIPNEHCQHIQDTFYPPCNFPYNSTAVLKRLQHSHITKEAFRYGTTAK